MPKNTKTKSKSKTSASRDSLVKSKRKSDIALSEPDLDKVAGGVRKAGKDQQDY